MNKTEINRLLPEAYEVLKKTGIADSRGEISKTYRGYISTFGAAVSGGSLLAAIAFFSDQGGAEKDRTNLISALNLLVQEDDAGRRPSGSLFDYVKRAVMTKEQGKTGIDTEKEAACKEKIMNAAIALKLAMNLYKFAEKEEK